MVYFLGNGLNSMKFKLDFYCNFECIPNPKYQDYLTLNIYNNNLNIKNKQNIINTIRNKCVMKLNDYDNILDWEGILKKLDKEKKMINENKLNKKIKQIFDMYNELSSKINNDLNKITNTVDKIQVEQDEENNAQQNMIDETPAEYK